MAKETLLDENVVALSAAMLETTPPMKTRIVP